MTDKQAVAILKEPMQHPILVKQAIRHAITVLEQMEEDKALKLIYIGDDYYFKSGSIMSSIYMESGERTDWGKVCVVLDEGKSVFIRPAMADELRSADEILKQITIGGDDQC